jgi:hypothetical protein
MGTLTAMAEHEVGDIDPVDFLRHVLAIKPEDAEKVREDAAKQMEREDRKRVEDQDAS